MSDSQSANRRVGTEWYTCDMCGTHYPRAKVIRQNGSIRCFGSGTHGCLDEPGHSAFLQETEVGYEADPEPLPDRDEDL